jgi:hypothetical protein
MTSGLDHVLPGKIVRESVPLPRRGVDLISGHDRKVDAQRLDPLGFDAESTAEVKAGGPGLDPES